MEEQLSVKSVKQTYLTLTLLNAMASSFIWGVHILFLLDAGLSNSEAFTANALFTAGMVLFEVPTGVVADTMGRRVSFLLGTFTLIACTMGYYTLWATQAPFWIWAIISVTIGLGFTFFSGAVDAWLVDALKHNGFDGKLEDVFAHGQIMNGVAMLIGAGLGGIIAQETNLGVPYLLRTATLILSFLFAYRAMKDLGFRPRKVGNIKDEIVSVAKSSIDTGFSRKDVRYMILTSPFIMGTSIYAFYAAQPLLIDLYHHPNAYSISGLSASLVAVSQILGGLAVPVIRPYFQKRTSILTVAIASSSLMLILVPIHKSFCWVLALIALWSFSSAVVKPIRNAYLNNCLPSGQRATLLSFDGLMGSSGGALTQPILGKMADGYGYALTIMISGIIQLAALPFLLLSRKQKSRSDLLNK